MNWSNLTNNKGTALYAVIIGITIVLTGILMFIVLFPMYTIMTNVAENSYNMTNATGYQALKNTWWMVPVAVSISGLIYVFINAQKREYIPMQY